MLDLLIDTSFVANAFGADAELEAAVPTIIDLAHVTHLASRL